MDIDEHGAPARSNRTDAIVEGRHEGWTTPRMRTARAPLQRLERARLRQRISRPDRLEG